MKASVSLSIPTPCTENWESFTSQGNGKFCQSCSKVVVDFTKMSDAQLLAYLQNKKGGCCGRFRSNQLKTYDRTEFKKANSSWMFFRAGLASLSMLFFNEQTIAKDITGKTNVEHAPIPFSIAPANALDSIRVSGIVKDEEGTLLPGVSVILQGSTMGTSTDAEGRFEFPAELKPGDILLFSFIGYQTKSFQITKTQSENLNITMPMDILELMGAVAVVDTCKEESGLKKFWNKVKVFFGA